MIEIKAVPGKLIMLGKQGENLAREVIFDVSSVRAEFEDGTFRLSAKRPGEADAYPATVTETGDTVVWALTGADTQNAGRGQCELAYYAGETRFKTWTYDTAIAKSLTGSPKTDPFDEFLDEVNRLAAEAAISQREAKNSENAAKNSEENAKASENAAKTSEDNAAEYARAALAAETESKQNAEYAASAATTAGQYAQNAATSATSAASSASAAEAHEKSAKDAADAAAKSAEGLADAVKRAEDAATSAQDNAGKTAVDREAVAGMKTAAETAQGNAETAATAAAGFTTSAGKSAAAAETSRAGAAEIKAQIDEIKVGIDTTKGEIDQAKADIDQTKTDTLAAKTAAETAAATATEKAAEIADSAAQIAENTENIGKNATGIETNAEDIDLLRRENVELRAKTDALWKLSEGKSYDFVEDATEAYSKDVPSGCRFAQVEKIGGKTAVWNQLRNLSSGTNVSAGITIFQNGATTKLSGAFQSRENGDTALYTSAVQFAMVQNHKYAILSSGYKLYYAVPYGSNISVLANAKSVILFTCTDVGNCIWCYAAVDKSKITDGVAVDETITSYAVDLTRLFGSGNEPTTTSDPRIAEIIAYAEKHPEYNAGELVSAGVEDVKVGFPEQSGSIVTISDGIDGHALDITTGWTPTQAGSGDPSPENIRPISGRDKITLTRTAGSDTQAATLSLPEAIYGGSVDQGGNGVKEWALLTLDGTEEWAIRDGYIGIYSFLPPNRGAICSHFTCKGSYSLDNNLMISTSGTAYLSSALSTKYTPDTWKSYLAAQKAAGTPVTIAYKLASPTTFTATGAKTITAKSGVNTVFSDADSVKVKYSDDDYPIPDAVKALPGYGWSAGNLCNEIVRRADGWDYVQRVDKKNLNSKAKALNQFGTYDGVNTFMIAPADGIPIMDIPFAGTMRQIASNRFLMAAQSVQSAVSAADVVWAMSVNSSLKYSYALYLRIPYTIKPGLSKASTSAEKEAAFKEWLASNPTTIYYEIAPITTDITDLMTGALPLMTTEPGGMITMHHALADDGLTLDVPNTIKYIRDLKEVASSGTE